MSVVIRPELARRFPRKEEVAFPERPFAVSVPRVGSPVTEQELQQLAKVIRQEILRIGKSGSVDGERALGDDMEALTVKRVEVRDSVLQICVDSKFARDEIIALPVDTVRVKGVNGSIHLLVQHTPGSAYEVALILHGISFSEQFRNFSAERKK